MNILIAVLIIFIVIPSAINSDYLPHLIPPVKAKKNDINSFSTNKFKSNNNKSLLRDTTYMLSL